MRVYYDGNTRFCVPKEVWRPIAQRHADAAGITLHQLLWGGPRRCFSMPRRLFWKQLRAQEHEPGRPYSFKAIAAITGHDHTSVMFSLGALGQRGGISKVVKKPGIKIERPGRLQRRKGQPGLPAIDMAGRVFGTVTVLSIAPTPAGILRQKDIYWNIRCTCGREKIMRGANLRSGNSASCGDKSHRKGPTTRKSSCAIYGGASFSVGLHGGWFK